MDDADIIRLAREIDELTDSKFRDTNMTELRERIRVRLGELAGKAKTMATTGWTDDEPGLVGDLKTFFTTDTPEPPSKAVLAARRKLARALLVVASKVEPKN